MTKNLWIGALIGAALGFAVGMVVFDNPFAGAAIGMALGVGISPAAKRREPRRLETLNRSSKQSFLTMCGPGNEANSHDSAEAPARDT
jgi:flagellar biosynthesis protein FliR